MERVDTLIKKLQQLYEQGAHTCDMIGVAQMLLNELYANYSSHKTLSNMVTVMLPFTPALSEEFEEEPNIPSIAAEQLHSKILEVPTLAAHQPFNTSEILPEKTLNDVLQPQQLEIAVALQEIPVKDLKKAISLNERYIFIQELFRGDEIMFERSIKTINSFHHLSEAEFWIERELRIKLGWNENHSAVKLFNQLVKRRFS